MRVIRDEPQVRKIRNLTRNPRYVSKTELIAIAQTLRNLEQIPNARIIENRVEQATRKGRSLIRLTQLSSLEKSIVDAIREKAYEVP